MTPEEVAAARFAAKLLAETKQDILAVVAIFMRSRGFPDPWWQEGAKAAVEAIEARLANATITAEASVAEVIDRRELSPVRER